MKPEKLENLQRVSVVGTSCSGKTTFARNLARALNVEYIEIDAINWLPGWVERPPDEFLELVEKAADRDSWVFDGNYSRTQNVVWGRATAVIWLNYSFSRTFYRALKRTITRAATGEAICGDNRETFRQSFFSRDSILLWVLQSHPRKRRRYTKIFESGELGAKDVYIFRHPREAETFLRQVEKANAQISSSHSPQ